MRAVVFDNTLAFHRDYPDPVPGRGQALIHVHTAGICRTDLELVKGYMGFKGILGHEFVGTVVDSQSGRLTGKRVVGEINAACGVCDVCRRGLDRHCPNRTVLGISRHDGCMADYCLLPEENLLLLSDGITDEHAVLIEPLSAACAIFEQVAIDPADTVVVLGDGKLGILCAWVLATACSDITLIGHHREKLETARWRHLKTALEGQAQIGPADVVVEATGAQSGLSAAIGCCRPRGKVVLKTTLAAALCIDMAPVVINEISIVGSRCGRFRDGLQLLAEYPDLPLERLITAGYPIHQAKQAFDRAAGSDALKVLLRMTGMGADAAV